MGRGGPKSMDADMDTRSWLFVRTVNDGPTAVCVRPERML
jgi:hypothetical protein